ncbi:MAG: efflux RND transporter periplasmic adaptor subunit [Gemmataceae bacterium]
MTESINSPLLVESPPAESPKGSQFASPSLLTRTLQAIPTVLILALLGGVAYAGHQRGWSFSSFAALTGSAAKDKDDWCEEHGVPESICVECNKDLLPKEREYGWCKEHGVAECPIDHPDLAQLPVPPMITSADFERARLALDFSPRPPNSSKCKLYQRRIQFVSKEAVEKAGIDVTPVWEAPMAESINANGEVGFDQARIARLSAKAPATVWRVMKKLGDSVAGGEVLALVDAAECGRAKGEFLQSLAQRDLRRETFKRYSEDKGGSVSLALYRQAEADLKAVEIRLMSAEQALANLGLPIRAEDVKDLGNEELSRRLRFLGIPESLSKTLNAKTTSGNLLPVVSPIAGVIVNREVVNGEVVDTAKALFIVADPRQMWLTLNLRQEDANRVTLGQHVRFLVDGSMQESQGSVSWISPEVDDKTRTVKVRANLANSEGRLRANSFGQGQIILRKESNALVVPNEAIHWEGDCTVVFVRDKNYLSEAAPKVFHVRQVRIGAKDRENTEVIAGILVGEVVATKGSGTLRAELLKNNLGEG